MNKFPSFSNLLKKADNSVAISVVLLFPQEKRYVHLNWLPPYPSVNFSPCVLFLITFEHFKQI